MGPLRCLLALLVQTAVLQPTLSQEDLCEPSFGYETFIPLKEDAEIGKVVLNVTTTGSADDVNLTLADNDHFAFNATTHQLYVKRQLDADSSTSTPTYRLMINCREASKPPVEISVVITLRDVNDNPPKFDEDHYYTSLGETTSVDQLFNPGVMATDADVSFNNRAVYYTVQDGPYSDYFQFPDTLDPKLLLRKPLDFETLPNMTITVVATNELSSIKLNSTALLTIQVTDEDDLNPVFTSPLYEGFILADSPMGTLVNVTPDIRASDADVTLDVPVVYSFHDQIFLFDRDARGSQNLFDIDPNTAQVRLVATPRKPTKVSVVVQATQADNPSRYGVAMLVITVGGVNSNAPQFQSDTYRVFVSEAVPVGTTVLFVSATDQDFGSAIRFSIVGGSSLFAIGEYSGAINVTAPLDFETKPMHTFTVMASDGNMNSTAKVEVKVVDSNDNAPVIPSDTQRTFKAERRRGAVITTIEAQDADAGTTLTYRLYNYDRLFSIDQSGAIRISAEASELTENVYQLLVVVSDNGQPPREKSVSVRVEFPPLSVTQATVMAGPSDDTMAIALGVIAAILLVVVVILVVYICRRRNQNSEQLDKAKANRSQDPRGLKFKNANRRLDHIQFQSDESLDGATTVQENPLKDAGAFNYGFVHPDDPENDRNMDEIHIETAVIPYQDADAYNNNNNHHNHHNGGGEMFQQEDSSDYGDTLPHKHSLLNGLYPDTSTESLNTTHTNSSGEGGSKHGLMANGTTSFAASSIGTTSFASTPIGTTSFSMKRGGGAGGGAGGAQGSALPAISLEGLDPDVSVAPQEQKSELTVYF